MHYRLHMSLTEADYLEFNNFHTLQSKTGKKMVRTRRIFFISVMVVSMALVFLILGQTLFSWIYNAVLGLYTLLYYGIFYKRVLRHSIKKQIERMKKAGKLPFDPVFDIEFLDDRYVEITPTSRIEQRYEALERICVVDSRFIYLYQTSVTAQILSIQQLREQVNEQEFLSFLSQRCRTVEYY